MGWNDFFQKWLYSVGGSDWSVASATMHPIPNSRGVRSTIVLKQLAEFTEPTSLGFKFDKTGGYDLRMPVIPPLSLTSGVFPAAGREAAGGGKFINPTLFPASHETKNLVGDSALFSGKETGANAPHLSPAPIGGVGKFQLGTVTPVHYETGPDGKIVTITVDLPQEPVQISVDPDQVLLDKNPSNNHWKTETDIKLTPLLTPLDETDITTSYDRWNIMAGPWLGLNRPQFGQKAYAGLRADLYRLHTFQGGGYLAWDADDLDLKAGADAILMHWPWSNTEIGGQYDHSMTDDWASLKRDRGRLYARYIKHETPSLYLNPMEYFELYGRVEHATDGMNRGRYVPPGVESYNDQAGVGLRWYRNFLTPYWDPEGGYKLDVNLEHGVPIMGTYSWYERMQAEFVLVKSMPEGLGYLSQTRWALRAYGGMGWPDNGYHYQLGGPARVRGLSRSDLEGDKLWVGTVEWRLPLWKNADADFLYRVARMQNLYTVLFYDAGEVYLNGKTNGGVVHSVGAGLRFDIGWLGFIERTTLRIDIARTVEENRNYQVWLGIQHAF